MPSPFEEFAPDPANGSYSIPDATRGERNASRVRSLSSREAQRRGGLVHAAVSVALTRCPETRCPDEIAALRSQ